MVGRLYHFDLPHGFFADGRNNAYAILKYIKGNGKLITQIKDGNSHTSTGLTWDYEPEDVPKGAKTTAAPKAIRRGNVVVKTTTEPLKKW